MSFLDTIKSTLSPILENFGHFRGWLNNVLISYEPILLIVISILLTHFVHLLINQIPLDGTYKGIKRKFFKIFRSLPIIKGKIASEIGKTEKEIQNDMLKLYTGKNESDCKFIKQLPYNGVEMKNIIGQVSKYLDLGHFDWQNGAVSGAVYHGEKALTELNTKIYEMSAWTNPLFASVFPGICKMEAEIVRMTAEIFHGNDDSCGSVTTGGSESILLAVKAYRDWGIEKGISHPEIVVPRTAHSAFDKASKLFLIKIKYARVDPKTFKVDIKAMERLINKNTVMLVGSTPTFPHGIIDDIESISKLGLKYSVPVHVDACLGGFVLPFMTEAGFPMPKLDFSLKGVTSISADPHKYGYTPKGCSVLLFRQKNYKKHQYFVEVDWPGGIYASPTLSGSRPGSVIAGSWATMQYFGRKGYIEESKKLIETARKIEKGIRDEIKELQIYGEPQMSLVSFGSNVKGLDIYDVSDKLKNRGWVLSAIQFPPGIHICLTHWQTKSGVAEKFIKDLKEIVKAIMVDVNKGILKKIEGTAAVYGMAQKIPDRSLVKEIATCYLDTLYRTQ